MTELFHIPNLSNLSATSTPTNGTTFIRVGNVVSVSGVINVTITSNSTATTFTLELPVASNLAGNDLTGSGGCTSGGANMPVLISADSINDRANISFVSTATGSQTLYFSFQYQIK